jgi:hypothetical protein
MVRRWLNITGRGEGFFLFEGDVAMRHELKTWPEFFQAIYSGSKTFEIRENDREFAYGDTLLLKEYDPKRDYFTGREVEVDVKYVLHADSVQRYGTGQGFGLRPGYVCMSIVL